ncbi:alpha/beta hydrolase [Sphingosinicella microcystinivorans]|uniref:alpha/beta hydrolase n=1 Tax=Sphingosinicella microcystinivorans TaxID=335406 RepID=UPI0022F3AD3E|nr:alpha/beta hydrolase-fold protein [Sphingosinicella microcystinivorans]WBX84216.1 alpha/beta hydrolase-fold protein [Sphingosinicella microcystinivorans]
MRNRLTFLITATLLSPLAAGVSQAAPAGGYTMPATQVLDMASDTDKPYRIMVSYPESEPPESGFPVLYVLDGNASFAAFAETRRIQEYGDLGKAIVVGVGYRTDKPYDEARNEDFIVMDDPPPGKRLGRTAGKSGRDEFLDFLTGKLRTEIGKRYRINPDRQALFGHSFGGLFALHALYTRPQAFHSIVAASPSLELDEGVLRDERAFVARLEDGKVGKTSRLMIVVGERDIDDDPEPARALADRLDRLSGLGMRVRFRSYETEGHMTVPARAVTDVLRFAFEIR